MLCEHAVYKDSDGSLYWNQWSEAHVDLAKERNLDCNVIKIKKNNLDYSTLNENVLSPYQKEVCMENSVDCNDRFLCYFATEVVNGIVKWHSVAREYVNLAQNRNLNCDIGQSY